MSYGGTSTELGTVSAAFCGFAFSPFLSFAQILKLYERMRFINIRQGTNLRGFLDSIADMLGKNEKQNAKEFWSQSSKYSGKMSEYKIKMFLDSSFILKLVMFYLTVIARWILGDFFKNMWLRRRALPNICKIMYYNRKIHFIALNLLMLDTYFYGTHAFLHFNIYEPDINYLISIGNMVFVTIDMVRVLFICLTVDKQSLSY
jgi:hypothetical protein